MRQLVVGSMGVVVFDWDEAEGSELATELGTGVLAVRGDVNDDGDVLEAIDAAVALGSLSLVVNVAGGAAADGGARRSAPRHGRVHGDDAAEHVWHVQRHPTGGGRHGSERARRVRAAGSRRQHRIGQPEEFALLVDAIARNACVTGNNIRLDGALHFPAK